MLDVLARSERYVDGVELDDLAGFGGSGGFGSTITFAGTMSACSVTTSPMRGRFVAAAAWA